MLFNEETIEAYVSGHLTGADKSLFEAGMEKDPLIMREVKMQEEIQSSLKARRKAELKQRLNNIDMTTASVNLGSKVAASVVISALVGAGLFMVINMTAEPETLVQSSASSIAAPAQTAPKAAAAPQAQTQTQTQTSAPAAQNQNVVQRPTAIITPASSEVVVDLPEVDVPTGTDVTTSGNGNTPNADFSNTAAVSEVKGNTVDKVAGYTKGYAYKYYSNKLFLYGFDNSTAAVNILEFNKGGKKQLFIYTNNKYYQIKDNQLEITPLKVIEDQSTINQLNSFAH